MFEERRHQIYRSDSSRVFSFSRRDTFRKFSQLKTGLMDLLHFFSWNKWQKVEREGKCGCHCNPGSFLFTSHPTLRVHFPFHADNVRVVKCELFWGGERAISFRHKRVQRLLEVSTPVLPWLLNLGEKDGLPLTQAEG